MKPDHHEILEAISNLKSEAWLGESRKWWPDFLFHFTHITNAVNILDNNKLLCRSEIENTPEHKMDIASQEVLRGTNQKWKNYVRLYFRPATPMQYNIEGIRPKNRLNDGAHCPVPIVFLFNSGPILTQSHVKFSDCNLASWWPNVGETGEFFRNLPFEKIYHSGSLHNFGPWDKRAVVRHRMAEVIVPKELDLENLNSILCRTQAEFQSFIHLISDETYEKWKEKIGVAGRIRLFNEHWTFVKRVVYKQTSIEFILNPGWFNGPYEVKSTIKDDETGKIYVYSKKNKYFNESLNLSFPEEVHGKTIEVLLTIDNYIAYNCILGNREDEEPF